MSICEWYYWSFIASKDRCDKNIFGSFHIMEKTILRIFFEWSISHDSLWIIYGISNTAAHMSANVILLFSSPSGNWNVLKTSMASSSANLSNIAILIESSFFSLPKAVKYIWYCCLNLLQFSGVFPSKLNALGLWKLSGHVLTPTSEHHVRINSKCRAEPVQSLLSHARFLRDIRCIGMRRPIG